MIQRQITINPDGPNNFTFLTFGSGVSIPGDPTSTNDGDNVADAVEALAPNNGDGNNDGTPDYEQVNVTSLPVLGGALGGGNTYVTVAAPENTELTNVYTIDPYNPEQVQTPPPDGMTLPEGLTNFIVEGVPEGADQIITIYTSDTENVTGYAKYDVATGAWSLLPSDRVSIFADRVEIRLTDGGEGDADGEVNGQIDDPGGLVIVTDNEPPKVVGEPTQPANGNGWYNGDVTVTWSASDPSPSSGGVSDPSPTALSTEGSDQTATSEWVCDNLGFCTQGTYSGIDIDRTAPEVSLAGVTDGETLQQGEVPTVTCTASDGLSGLDGNCALTLIDQPAEGLGQFTYEATATDLAGNTGHARVTFTVEKPADAVPPVISIVNPTNHAEFVQGATAVADYTCTDEGDSGLAACQGSVPTGELLDTSTLGDHTFTVTARDGAGNESTETRTYTVLPWTLRGFYSPVDMGGVRNTVKGGSTVPLKFEVFQGDRELVDPAEAVMGFGVKKVSCATGTAEDAVEATTAGDTSLRYDASAGQFIQNWKTPKLPDTCYAVTVTTKDSSTLVASFRLK